MAVVFLSALLWAALQAPVFAEPPAVSTFSVRGEGIPSGVLLLFPPQDSWKERLDTFRVYRSSRTAGSSPDGEMIAELNYYHDWYKDYFQFQDIGRTLYYRVEAYDLQKNIMGVSQPDWIPWKVRRPPPTGAVLTPTAYRRVPIYDTPYSGASRLLPINIDLNASYYIGKLYSHNELHQLTNTRNSLFTRLGVWFLQLDAKLILEREGRLFPQLAVGGEGSTMVRDTSQPTFQNPTIPSFSVKKENSRTFSSAFLAASKQIGWIRPTVGYMNGNSGSKIVYLTEFLAKESTVSDSSLFCNMDISIGKRFSLQWEYLHPLRSIAAPYLVNLQVGRALHTNFDLAYLHFDKGYEVLGHLNFRFTLYPASSSGK